MKLPWAKKFSVFHGILLSLLASFPVAAQIKPDATLPHNSLVTSKQGNIIQIDGGTRAGNNLFHSFTQFNVPTGGTAFFNNALDVQNIFSRVTGSTVSNIDGILKANGTASLFLLNPNGIIFGKNAQLNIGGSFVATTAHAIKFGNLGVFSAVAPNNPMATPRLGLSGLTIEPEALLFNQIAAQKTSSISNQGSLQVNQGGSLLLVGGNVSLDGGSLLAPGGRVELGGLTASGTIELNVAGNNLRLNFPSDAALANISLTNAAQINTRAGGGGDVAITAQNLRISGGSTIQTGIASGMGSPTSSSGDININVPGTISMTGSSQITNQVLEQGIGDSGNVNITTGNLQATNGSYLLSRNRGMGNGGTVTVVARDTISFDGIDSDGNSSGVYSNVRLESAVGNGGNINLIARALWLTNGAQLSANTIGHGNAGNINITATDLVKFDGVFSDGSPSGAYAAVGTTAIGNGGNINIISSKISVTDGAQLVTSTSGQGNAGNVSIIANIASFDGANLNGQSSAGIGSGIYARVGRRSTGKGGSISVAAESFSITNGAQIAATTSGSGIAGDILVISPTVRISGLGIDGSTHSGLFTSGLNNSTGNGGNIDIRTSRLNLTDLGQISAQSQGSGTAGAIAILANQSLDVNNGAIVASATRSGGGHISITASDARLRNNSTISTSVFDGTGGGGNISFNPRTLVVLENSNIAANAFQGNGGNITIGAQGIFRSPDSAITASSQFGVNGVVQIKILGFDVSNILTPITNRFASTEQAIAGSCLATRNIKQGRFVYTGTGGLKPTPYDPLVGRYNLVELQLLPGNRSAVPSQGKPETATWKIGDPIVEATSIVRTPDGRVLLSATPENTKPESASELVCYSNEDKLKS